MSSELLGSNLAQTIDSFVSFDDRSFMQLRLSLVADALVKLFRTWSTYSELMI